MLWWWVVVVVVVDHAGTDRLTVLPLDSVGHFVLSSSLSLDELHPLHDKNHAPWIVLLDNNNGCRLFDGIFRTVHVYERQYHDRSE